MADQKVNELTLTTAPASTDLIMLVGQSSNEGKVMTWSQLASNWATPSDLSAATTPTAVTFSAGTNVTIARQICYVVGKIYIIHAAIVTSAALSNAAVLMSGTSALVGLQDFELHLSGGNGNYQGRTNGSADLIVNGSLPAGTYFIDTVLIAS